MGFLTFVDRPKSDAGTSIARLHDLGVDVKIITGDNGIVAAKVCSDIGLEASGLVNGFDLDALDDDALACRYPGHDRVRPGEPGAEVADHQGG